MNPKKMTMTAAGDCILVQGFQEGGYEGFEAVKSYVEKGQAKFANLEMTVTEGGAYASSYCGGVWITARPKVLPKVLSYGFNFLSFANNHTMDYGPDGMLETLSHVKKYDVEIAGAGKDLGDASRPVYRDFEGGRVALISIAASFADPARAGYRTQNLPGRPGLNPLRSKRHFTVTREHLEVLKEIAKNTEINGPRENSRRDGFQPPLPDGVFALEDIPFQLTQNGKEEQFTKCNKFDLQRTVTSIQDAKKIADYVVILLHAHHNAGKAMSEPAQFVKEFCRAAVDAGADAVVGTGTHQLKPIEIRNGKPIFYSLGNFCFQLNALELAPYDLREKINDPSLSDVAANNALLKTDTVGLFMQDHNFRTVIPYMEFTEGKLTHLELKPVELGFDKGGAFKGIPYFADEKVSGEICARLQTLSGPYGTKMELKDGVIQVEL